MSRYEGSPDEIDESVRVAKEQSMPAARQLDGFKGALALADRRDGRTDRDHALGERGGDARQRGGAEPHPRARPHGKRADRLRRALRSDARRARLSAEDPI